MIECNEEGQPVVKSMEIQRLGGKLGTVNSKVKYTKWAADPKPWKDYPIKSKRMHTSTETHYFYDLAKKLPRHSNIANLGVGKGISCAAMAYGLRESGNEDSVIFGVDLFNHVPDLDKPDLEKIYKDLGLNKYISLCKGYTHEWAQHFKSFKFQYLFVDADHHYETCKQDVEMWSPMLSVGGLMSFHDVDMNTIDRVISELDPCQWSLVDHVYRIKTFRRKQ